MVTDGDRFLSAPLTEVGGKNMFIKELEQAMLDGAADIAVHSVKAVTFSYPHLTQPTIYAFLPLIVVAY